jgi:hypothetical protein
MAFTLANKLSLALSRVVSNNTGEGEDELADLI